MEEASPAKYFSGHKSAGQEGRRVVDEEAREEEEEEEEEDRDRKTSGNRSMGWKSARANDLHDDWIFI